MKKRLIALLVILLTMHTLYAQSNAFTLTDSAAITAQRWRDTCFGLLNLSASQIPSGYLIDYSLMAFNDSNFNSLINPNIDTLLDAGNFFSIHSILGASAVNSSATLLGSTDSLFINASRYWRNNASMPLIFLYQPFQKIRTAAKSQGLLTFTSDSVRLQDVAGRTISPYDNKLVFAFSPFQNVISKSGSLSFSLPAAFWLMPGITSVQIDFGDGLGLRTLTPGSTASVDYPSSGTYYLVAKITTGGNTLTAKSSIRYTLPTDYIHSDSVWHTTVAPLYSSISDYIASNQSLSAGTNRVTIDRVGPVPLGGPLSCSDGSIFNSENCDISPGATVYIQNGCDHIFDKPIIIVQGFDPTGSTTVESLVTQFNTKLSANLPFYDQMRTQGYDFVFVIFTKNLDFIENNAKVLEGVIQRVNGTKSGTNKNTVIGFSMGGLIARYALKDMENLGIDHQTANYFSYDAPQQGANVPLGLQCLFKEMLNDMPELKWSSQINKLNGAFTSYAAQQMLATYASYSGSSLQSSALNQVRAIFAQKLINLGYPQTTNNYAISNGRGNNTTGTSNAGNGAQWGSFGPGSAIFQGGVNFFLIAFSATAYAVPSNNSTGSILKYKFIGIKVAKIFGIPVLPYLAIRNRNIVYQGAYPYEDAPGGYETTQSQFVSNLNTKNSFNIFNTSLSVTFYNYGAAGPATNYGHFGHNFISVASALDLQNQGYGSSNNYQSNNMYYAIDNSIVNPGQVTGNTLSPTTLSPFKAVLTSTSDCASGTSCASYTWDPDLLINYSNPYLNETNNWNLWHEASISNQTALFMQRKIMGTNTFTGCSGSNTFCGASIGISGPSPVCSTATFSLTNFAYVQAVTIVWSFPNATLKITKGQGTPTVTVAKLKDGNETATVMITNACGQTAAFTLPIITGSVAPSYITTSATSGNPCTDDYNLYTTPVPGATSYNWMFWNTTGSVSNNEVFNNVYNQYSVWLDQGSGLYNIGVQANNICGTSLIYFIQVPISCGSGSNAIRITPNPSTGIVSVATTAAAEQTTATTSTATSRTLNSRLPKLTSSHKKINEIKVYSPTGALVKKFSYSTGTDSENIDLSNLADGIYIIQVIYDGEKTTQKIVLMK